VTTSWIDSHAHLTMFEPDEVGEVLDRAHDEGVRAVVVPATGPDDLDRTLALGREHPGRVAVAAGVHPHEAASLDDGARRRIEAALAEPGVVAVGEIGLDYHYMNSPREDQLAALAWQLDLALAADRPVILHNRESWDDLARIVGARAGDLRGVCHSFTEAPARARRVLQWGLYVGISGMVTFRQADNIRDMTRAIDLDRLLVETDSPFLAPVPHRGRRNEPSFVPLVGEAVARVLGLEPAAVAAATTANAGRLFGVGEPAIGGEA
jgi:TatD DNase family protein